MSVEFHVGAQVVCVDDVYHTGEAGDHLERGRVYTIRKIDPAHPFVDTAFRPVTLPGLWLEEARRVCPRIIVGDPQDVAWSALRFRPVRKTDISVFTAMLTPTKVTEDA